LAKFEKRLSKLYEQLLKSKSSSCKKTFTTTALLEKIELYLWRFGRWAMDYATNFAKGGREGKTMPQ
jgi:hypothetical protein